LIILLGVDAVMGGAIYFYLANELLSVIENCGRMGLPLPPKLIRIVKVLRDRAGEPATQANGSQNPRIKKIKMIVEFVRKRPLFNDLSNV
jgi:hypothetical protein